MDVSKELAKRISRRQFLFGGGNSGGGGSEAGVLGAVLGAAGIGVGVMALGSPGPSSQSFQDAYVQKTPAVITQRVKPTVNPHQFYFESQDALSNLLVEIFNGSAPSLQSDFVNPGSDTDMAFYIANGAVLLGAKIRPAAGFTYQQFGGSGFPLGLPGRIALVGDSLADQGGLFLDPDGVNADWLAAGAQVGQPTGAAGVQTGTMVLGQHRHAFSGRFGIGPGPIRDASLGGATPAKFTRLISNNNWTLRRLSVFALTAPAGTGSDTYGVVNAAGTLQGTAVSLAVGATENATALQVTNLTGGTVYYFAVTARATTPALDVTLVPEYTMNV